MPRLVKVRRSAPVASPTLEVTIPREIVLKLGLRAGERLEVLFDERTGQIVYRRPRGERGG